MKRIFRKFPNSLLFDTRDIKVYNLEILRRASHVAYVLFLLGVIIVFRTIYIATIFRYKYGILQEDISYVLNYSSYRTVGTILIFSIGYFLFRLKQRYQILYGLLETGFAVATSYTIVDNLQKVLMRSKIDLFVFFPIMTCLYLVVRGLSNVSDGMKKNKEQKLKADIGNDILNG